MSVYLVNGPRAYREHQPGETFEARLPADVEARAVALGAITVIDSSPPTIQPGSWRMPIGWPDPSPPTQQEE